MSITMHDAPAHTAVQPSSDHRLALLTARAGLEPELAQRYTSDPVSVLAEFGLTATEPVYGDVSGHDAYKLGTPVGQGRGLVIDHLDRPENATLYGCYSGMAPLPGEEAGTALA
ncbi:hypothetical protein OG206_10590 [Streptomyces sp. NBC_01341]|uniref:hypothetical protein n=1 Tax=Streptomyces sp. NBC_01341 TaxID=2903831 RepID=UPI002E109A06|nr:hypothetical protein OG206_10590 [Streptomyces sp. NBC_01341]